MRLARVTRGDNWRHLLLGLTFRGQCCGLHVVGQQVVIDISVIRSYWSICSLCFETNNNTNLLYYAPAHWCSWNVYFALNIKRSLPYNIAAYTWWDTVTSLHLCYIHTDTRQNVKVHYNFVDSIETLKKFVSRLSVPIKFDLVEFTDIFPSTTFVSPAARRLMILHRLQQSTLFDIRMTD